MWGQGGGGWGGWGGGQPGQEQGQGGGRQRPHFFQGLMQRLQQQAPFGGQRGPQQGQPGQAPGQQPGQPFGGIRPPMMGGQAPQGNFAAPTPDARMMQAQNLQGFDRAAAGQQPMQQYAGAGGTAGPTANPAAAYGALNAQNAQYAQNRTAQGAPIYRKQDEQY